MLKCVEYGCPIIVLIIIAVLKISVDDTVKLERIKRIIVETSIDIMSLAISFVISFIIAIVNQINFENMSEMLATGFICFVVYIILLIFTVLSSKFFIRKYSETEKTLHLILGVAIGYLIAIPSLYHSIELLQSLGGV